MIDISKPWPRSISAAALSDCVGVVSLSGEPLFGEPLLVLSGLFLLLPVIVEEQREKDLENQ